MDNSFSANLRRIRKEKGATQEQLAAAAGVSPQAVSKWEAGSFPDPQLLPNIADFLDVTIDELFGHGEPDGDCIEQRVQRYLRSLPEDKIFPRMLDICYTFCQTCCGVQEYHPIEEVFRNADNWLSFSDAFSNMGWGLLQSCSGLPFFLLMPQPAGGYDKILGYDPKMAELLRFLSEPNVLRAMYFLTGRTQMYFTRKTLEHELSATAENAEKIIEGMLSFGFIWIADLNSGEITEKIYTYKVDKYFMAFITFLWLLLHIPSGGSFRTESRNTPLFRNDTYKKEK